MTPLTPWLMDASSDAICYARSYWIDGDGVTRAFVKKIDFFAHLGAVPLDAEPIGGGKAGRWNPPMVRLSALPGGDRR